MRACLAGEQTWVAEREQIVHGDHQRQAPPASGRGRREVQDLGAGAGSGPREALRVVQGLAAQALHDPPDGRGRHTPDRPDRYDPDAGALLQRLLQLRGVTSQSRAVDEGVRDVQAHRDRMVAAHSSANPAR